MTRESTSISPDNASCQPRNRRRPHFGAAAVEFAVCAVVLVILVFGGIELARASMLQHIADHAAYIAAREVIIPGADANTAKAVANDYMNKLGVTGASIAVNPTTITDSDTEVDVTVTLPSSGNLWVTPQFVLGNLEGSCRLMTERSPAQLSNSLPEPPPPPAPPTPPPSPTPTPTPSPTPTPTPAPTPAPPPPPPPNL